MNEPAQDAAYEWRVVLLLGLGLGLVGLDRWIIAPLFPAMMRDLSLTYQDLGNLVAVLAIAWGVFSTVMGRMADRFGRRRVLIPGLLIFSLLAGFTGAASGLAALFIIRAVMGASEGAFLAASVAATGDASRPERRGFNQGLQLSTFSLFGFGLGPLIATQLLGVLPSWRYVFVIVALPGFVLAWLIHRVLREPAHILRAQGPQVLPRWGDLFAHSNVIVAMLGILCTMGCIFVLGGMFPTYLVDYLQLPLASMGVVMSAQGFGGFIGAFSLLALSDRIGRKPAALLMMVGAALATYALMRTGADPVRLFAMLFIVSFFCGGLLALFTGPVATEAVPVTLVSSAIGLVSGAGEIFGGGVAPVIAGFVAQRYGIEHVLDVALVALTIGILVSLFLRETAPRRLSAKHIPA